MIGGATCSASWVLQRWRIQSVRDRPALDASACQYVFSSAEMRMCSLSTVHLHCAYRTRRYCTRNRSVRVQGIGVCTRRLSGRGFAWRWCGIGRGCWCGLLHWTGGGYSGGSLLNLLESSLLLGLGSFPACAEEFEQPLVSRFRVHRLAGKVRRLLSQETHLVNGDGGRDHAPREGVLLEVFRANAVEYLPSDYLESGSKITLPLLAQGKGLGTPFSVCPLAQGAVWHT